MSTTTSGQISYGIRFEEGYTFPWDDEESEGDEDVWWDNMGKDYSMPAAKVNYCSSAVDTFFLAVPSSVQTVDRGRPKQFDPALLIVSEHERQALLDFCKEYGIKHEGEPAWYLSSYWGQ